jgi:hypothetical protein
VGAVADEQEAELASPDGGASDGVGIDEPVSEPAPSDAGAHAGTADDGDAPETASSGASADMGGTPDPEHTHGASMSTSVGTERAHVGISLGRGRIADLDADDVSFHEDPPDGASAQDARAPDALSAFWAASAAVDRSNAAVAGDGDDAPPDTWFDPSLSDDAGESAESDDTDDSAESSDAAPDAAVRGAVVKAPRVTSTPE